MSDSDSEEYYTDEDESLVVASSASGRSSRSQNSRQSSSRGSKSNVTVDETDSGDSDINPVARKATNRKHKAAAIISSDSEDDEHERVFSPRTRMSITGIRPKDLASDDSSEIDYSEEGEDADKTYDEHAEREEAAAARYRRATNNELVGGHSPRYSTQFVDEMEQQNTLHSTIFPADIPEVMEDSSGSDVLILSNRETPIEISSTDDDTSFNKENISASNSSAGLPKAPVIKSTKNLVQPTIQTALKQSISPAAPAPRRSRIKSEDPQVVSREFYQEETRKLSEMRGQLNDAIKLYEKVSHKLPDKGIQIRKRIQGLQQEIEDKNKYVNSLKVEQGPQVPAIKLNARKSQETTNQAPDWDALSSEVNQIKPTHTGARGMATFNTQKTLTVESLKDLHGSLKDCPAENVLADDPKGLKVSLMDHQKHALAWMAWREKQSPRGGILADDMGLGKTLTMISLVLSCKNERESGAGAGSDSEEEDERDKKRKSMTGWSSKGRKDSYSGGTLVVCPASLLRQWEGEVNSKLTRNRLTVCVHHGNNRESKPKHLRTYDIVVTTYQIVAREHNKTSALFGVKWRRIILDEAHVVRNHKSQCSMAVSELMGKNRWALTGTPIQNKELDVYALLKFLRCSPFDDLVTWKRWIDNKSAGGQGRLNLVMKSIMLRRTKAQLQLEGKLNSLPNKEMRVIEITLDKDEMNVYQKVMAYSRTLFAQFLFQRAEKDSDANFINDGNKPTYNQIKDPNGAYYKMHEKFSKMAGHNKEVKSHEILVLLLRLRQICCHPGLIDAMLEDENTDRMGHDSSEEDSPEIDLLAQLNKLAISDTSTSSQRSSRGSRGADEAPPLRGDEARIAKASKNVLKRSNPVFNLQRPSSKIIKVMEILKSSILKSNDKVIIVSQWTSVLNMLREHLDKERLSSLSLNGAVAVKSRQDIVNQFNDAKNPKRILLLSLTAGGVGLNLIGANHLMLLDLHWNPQLESQAQDRIYRVGQQKDVIIYKLMCVDTVEQRIKALQDRKLELAEGVLTGGKVSTKLTIDDLKGLFSM